jgi:hypothetical protein
MNIQSILSFIDKTVLKLINNIVIRENNLDDDDDHRTNVEHIIDIIDEPIYYVYCNSVYNTASSPICDMV